MAAIIDRYTVAARPGLRTSDVAAALNERTRLSAQGAGAFLTNGSLAHTRATKRSTARKAL